MAVKYVKDFSFPASGGFHGGVQRFAKGGHVTKVPAKAKASAKDVPARAKPNAPARGAPKMKSEPAKGKRQGYNEGGRVPGYDMDRLPAKKPPGRTMDLAPARRFKGAYEGYADGGDVAPLPFLGKGSDRGKSPQMPENYVGPGPVGPMVAEEYDFAPEPRFELDPMEDPELYSRMRPSEPLTYRWSDGTYNYLPEETGKRTPLRALSSSLRAKDPRSQEPVYARDVETRLDRGVRPGQMARQQRVEDRVNAARQALFEDKAPRYEIQPYLPLEEPSVRIPREPRGGFGPLPPEEPPMRIPREPQGGFALLPPELPGIRIDEGRESIMPVPGPGGGGLSDLIGSPSARERMPAPYMPTYTPSTPEESDAYLKAAGIVPRAEARFAKGGKVQKVMREYKEGKLHSGSKKGPLVKNREQAVAIALSEARKAGAKIPKKGEGGIFNDESMAYQSKGPKTRYTPAKRRREARERDMDRRALDKARHAEKFAPGMSLDMRAKGGMMKGKKFPDLTGDGKVTRADILKGRGVIKDRKMPTHNRKPMYGKG